MAERKRLEATARVHGRTAAAPRPTGPALKQPGRFLEDHGFLGHINLRILHPFGLAMEEAPDGVGLYVLDHRARPFTVYSPQEYRTQTERWDRYLKQQGAATMGTRREGLGYIIQRESE